MPSIDLSKKVGPLPVGAWIVVVGVGIGIAYFNYRQSLAPTTPVEDTSGQPGVGDGSVGGWVSTQPAPGGTTNPTTNDEWARLAINHLIASNYPPVTADTAVRKYLAGESLSVSETALMAIVLAKFGSPPQPLPPGAPNEPLPPPQAPGAPKPKPPIGTRVSVPLNRNLYEWTAQIAAAYNIPYSMAIMRVLNPGIDRYIVWLPGTPKVPVFQPSGGVPPVRIR